MSRCPTSLARRRALGAILAAAALGLSLNGPRTLPSAVAARAQSPAPSLAGCPMLPPDDIWNTRVDDLPVHARSAAWIRSIGSDTGLHADFGAGLWNGGPIGIPYVVVPGTQPKVPVRFEYADESDPGPYPIPPNAPIEGGPQSDGDRHILVLDKDNCRLYETWSTYPEGGGWRAGSGAIFDLDSSKLRPDGWTSSDAAGLPVLPGLVRYDEVAAGAVRHATRFTVQRSQRAYLWPARHFASSIRDVDVPPMGARLRLKAGVDLSRFSPSTRVILQGFKDYGLLLADNGSNWFISGVPDERWNNDLLRELRNVHGSDFEVVDASGLMIDPDSGKARQPGGGEPPTATAEPTQAPTTLPTDIATATATPQSGPTETGVPEPSATERVAIGTAVTWDDPRLYLPLLARERR